MATTGVKLDEVDLRGYLHILGVGAGVSAAAVDVVVVVAALHLCPCYYARCRPECCHRVVVATVDWLRVVAHSCLSFVVWLTFCESFFVVHVCLCVSVCLIGCLLLLLLTCFYV